MDHGPAKHGLGMHLVFSLERPAGGSVARPQPCGPLAA
jgi:hypothetical protein